MMRRVIAVSAAALLVAGCSHYEPLALHGGASMRVEVEVYKGPLTASVPGQIGQIAGVLSNSIHAVYDWRQKARTYTGCSKTAPTPECEALLNAIDTSEDIVDAACYMIRTPTLDAIAGRAVYVPMGTCRQFDAEKRAASPEFSGQQSAWDVARELRAKDFQPSDGRAPTGSSTAETRNSASAQAEQLARSSSVRPGRIAQIYRLQVDADRCVDAFPDSMFEQFRCQGEVIGIAFDNYAAILSGAALRASDATVGRVPTDARGRALLVEYASLTAEYGQQVHARIAVLQKQMDPNWNRAPREAALSSDPASLKGPPRDPKTLPVSDYLQDAERTDYIQLYDWLKAGEVYRGSASGMLTPEERIRMAQRLTADSYWQKVNEVYASGQGEVAMAFIKDDLGNWNLKSFSNDPAELLAAYRKVTDATIMTAVNLAKKAGTGPAGDVVERLSSAQKATNLATQFASGEVPGTPGVVGGVNIGALHSRTVAHLASQKDRFVELEKRLGEEKTRQEGVAETKKTEKGAAAQRLESETLALKNAQAARETNTAALATQVAVLDRKVADGTNTPADQTLVDTARSKLNESQALVEAKILAVDQAQRDLDTATIALAEADAKKAAAAQRLADLPKEAIEAARGTLDDHMVVISSLQEGIMATPPPPPAKAGARGVPGRPPIP